MINILYLHAGAELYGADIVLYELLKRIDKRIIKPYVVLPCDGPLVQKLKEINIEVCVMEYPILRRKYFNIKGIFNYFINLKKYTVKLMKFCKENSIKIVHTNTSAVLEGMFLKKNINIVHVWHIHEIILKPKLVYKILCFCISRYSDKVVTVSKATMNHLIESKLFKNKKIDVIYNGVDNEKFNPYIDSYQLRSEFDIKNDDLVVGMIGRVNSWKGQEHFVKALDKVMDNDKNVKAILVGSTFEGEEWRFEKLNTLIENSNNKKNFILQGFRNDTPKVYNLCDIFVLPSTNPDPLPTVVLEAMACGKAIVAYRHGGVTEMVKENYNGLFAEVNNIDDLSEKIQRLISNKKIIKNFGDNSIGIQKSKFSLESYVNNFTDIYCKLLEGNDSFD